MQPPVIAAFDPMPRRPQVRTAALHRLELDGGPLRAADMQQLLAFAMQAEQRLAEQARRIAELESLSLTDELTGLANRRAFHQTLQRTLALASRHGEDGSLVYIDLDGFKRINDRHGHDAGDAALKHVARLLTGHLRTTDFVARLHGDEFAVLMARAAAPDAAERMRTLRHLLTLSPLDWHGRTIRLGASFGVVAYDAAHCDAASLLRAADRAMYGQKHGETRAPLAEAAE